ncbi:HPGD [Bugula neritina]|uniref:15-hydroxyprostaglandin dehydrogenase [NAD(+)] n=1 Tax=Bugula neritina TaxID=10212 RepID=A0A7J7J4C2_BUGNE|nr:HPGD [Bugula neritina]
MIIKEKIALVTGAGSGLGNDFASALLKEKAAAVCLVDIVENGDKIASDLQKEFPQSDVTFYHCDVTNHSLFQGAFEFVKKRYGHIDIVCNSAGVAAYDQELEASVRALRVNLEAVYYGTKLGMEYMDKEKARGGVIINIASTAAFYPTDSGMCYNASKAGCVSLTQSAGSRYNLERCGVRVNALCPSLVDTPMISSTPGLREMIAALPNGRHEFLSIKAVVQGFLQLVENAELFGVAMAITPWSGTSIIRNNQNYITFEM